MGCDVHPMFEVKTEKGWEPLFPVRVAYWDDVLDEKVADGTAHTITGTADDDEARERFEVILEELSDEEALEKFGHAAYLDFSPPQEVRWRSYHFFGFIGNTHRAYNKSDVVFPARGMPEDASRWVAAHVKRMEGDYHTHSWLMLDELLSHPRIGDFQPQCRALQEVAKKGDPKKIRMVFAFDN